jgi:flagellar hook-length control protein FliK
MATQPGLSNALLSIGGLNSGSSLSGLSSGLSGLGALGSQSGLAGISSTGSTFYQQLSEWSSIQQSGGELPAEAVAWLKTASYQASMSQQTGWMATGNGDDGSGGNFLPLSLTSFDESLAALQGQWQSLQGQTGFDGFTSLLDSSDGLDIDGLMNQVLAQNGLTEQSGLLSSGFDVSDWTAQMQRFLEQAQQAMQAMSEQLQTAVDTQEGQSETGSEQNTLLQSLTVLLDELDALKDQIESQLPSLESETSTDGEATSYTAGLDAFLNTALAQSAQEGEASAEADSTLLSVESSSATVQEHVTEWMARVSEWVATAKENVTQPESTQTSATNAQGSEGQWVDMSVSVTPDQAGKWVEGMIPPSNQPMLDAERVSQQASEASDTVLDELSIQAAQIAESTQASSTTEADTPWISTGRPDVTPAQVANNARTTSTVSAASLSVDADRSTVSVSMTDVVGDESADDLLKGATVSLASDGESPQKTAQARSDLLSVNTTKPQADLQQSMSPQADSAGADDVAAPKEASTRVGTESSLASLSQSTQWAQRGTSQVNMNMPAGMAPGQEGWSQALSERIVWASNQRLQSATLQLDPPELGALQVKLHVSADQQVSVTFSSPHAHVRDAVEQSVPRLREMLSEQGLQLGDANVGDQGADRSQAQAEGRGNGQGYGQAGNGLLGDDAGDEITTSVQSGSVSLVDYYA